MMREKLHPTYYVDMLFYFIFYRKANQTQRTQDLRTNAR